MVEIRRIPLDLNRREVVAPSNKNTVTQTTDIKKQFDITPKDIRQQSEIPTDFKPKFVSKKQITEREELKLKKQTQPKPVFIPKANMGKPTKPNTYANNQKSGETKKSVPTQKLSFKSREEAKVDSYEETQSTLSFKYQRPKHNKYVNGSDISVKIYLPGCLEGNISYRPTTAQVLAAMRIKYPDVQSLTEKDAKSLSRREERYAMVGIESHTPERKVNECYQVTRISADTVQKWFSVDKFNRDIKPGMSKEQIIGIYIYKLANGNRYEWSSIQ